MTTIEHEVASLLFRQSRALVGLQPWEPKQPCVLSEFDKTGRGDKKLLQIAALARRIEAMSQFPWPVMEAATLLYLQGRSFAGLPWSSGFRPEDRPPRPNWDQSTGWARSGWKNDTREQIAERTENLMPGIQAHREAASLLFQQDRSFSGKPWDDYCCIPADGADGKPLNKLGSLVTSVEAVQAVPWVGPGQGARPRTYIELCTGSFAVGLRLLGGARAKPPVSYMGSKVGYGAAILAALGLRPGQGADRVVMVEPGPWAKIWTVLATPEGCAEVASILRGWIPCPRGCGAKGDGGSCEDCDGTGRWATKRLWDHLRAIQYPPATPAQPALQRSPCVVQASAYEVQPEDVLASPEGCVVYIDPPYEDTTGYLHDFPRSQVIEVAKRWSDFGATVAISEAARIDIPGWHHVDVAHTRRGTKRSFGDTEEWLTMNRAPVRVAPKKLTWFG